jgi:HNH endonuclease
VTSSLAPTVERPIFPTFAITGLRDEIGAGVTALNDFLAASYWKNTCPITGITDSALLRASHIIPWARCESDAERMDVHNGLLLSSLWDAAFDQGRGTDLSTD